MFYTKPDGTHGFSWKTQSDFLLREHPENLEKIAHARLEALAKEEPEDAAYYQDLSMQLRKKLDKSVQSDADFGYVRADVITKEFIQENYLTHLFEAVPALSGEDEPDLSLLDDEVDLSFLDEELERITLITPWKP